MAEKDVMRFVMKGLSEIAQNFLENFFWNEHQKYKWGWGSGIDYHYITPPLIFHQSHPKLFFLHGKQFRELMGCQFIKRDVRIQ